MEAFIEKNYKNASEEKKNHIREVYNAGSAANSGNAQANGTTQQMTDEAASNGRSEKKQLNNALRFAGQVKRRFGVNVEVVEPTHKKLALKDGGSASAAYDRETDTIYVSSKATQGDVIRAKVVHELTHRVEKTGAYKEFSDAVLKAYFKGNKQNENSMRNRIKARYQNAGVNLTAEGLEHELVAYATEKLIGGDQDMVNRIVSDSPSVARRVMDAIKNVLDKMKGVKDPEIDQLRKLEKMFKKALDEAQTKEQGAVSKKNDIVQYSIDDDYLQALIDRDSKTAERLLEEEMAARSISWSFKAYRKASDALMGFSADGKPQKGFGEHPGYKTVVTVAVRFPDDPEVMIERMDGLNPAHAMERARRTWLDAEEIRWVSDEDEPLVRYDANGDIVLPSKRFGYAADWMKKKKAAPGVDLYDDKSYNDYGWIRANGIMSAAEWDNFDERLAGFDYGSNSEYVKPNGRVVLNTRDDNGNMGLITVFTGGYQSPSVELVYRLHWETTPEEVQRFTEELEAYEYEMGEDASRFAAVDVKNGAVEIFKAQDYRRGERTVGRPGGMYDEDGTDYRPSADVQNGDGRDQEAGRGRIVNNENVQLSIDDSILPDDEYLLAEIEEWKRGSGDIVSEPLTSKTGERQFATKTIQQNAYVPDHIKQTFLNDPTRREYSRAMERERIREGSQEPAGCGRFYAGRQAVQRGLRGIGHADYLSFTVYRQ